MSKQPNAWATCKEYFRREIDKLIATASDTFATWRGYQLMEYNIINDKWTKSLQCPDDTLMYPVPQNSFEFDTKNKIWYIYQAKRHKSELIIINCINTNCNVYDVSYFGAHVKSILLKNRLHIIGGMENNKHVIWNNNTKQFEQMHTFNEYANGYCLPHDIAFIKSKNMLLLFGGAMSGLDVMDSVQLGVIYKYNILNQKWNKLSVEMSTPFRINFGVSSILNDQLVLLFGGYNNRLTDKILIYNVLTQTFTESTKRCPISGIFKAITMHNNKKDQLTVFGYVRKQWNVLTISLDRFPPFYLIQAIHNWYWTGYTHLIDINCGKHWKIDPLELL